MKVVLANKFFFRNGGSEAVFFGEREYLLSNGVEVVDFAMNDSRNEPSRYSQYFVRHKEYGRATSGRRRWSASLRDSLELIHSFEAVSKFRKLIKDTRPNLVHCHNIYHQITPSIIGAAKDANIPVVLTLHDYKPICPTYVRLRNGRPCSECIDGGFSSVIKHRCAGGSLLKSSLLYAEAVVQRIKRSYEQVDLVFAPSEFMASSAGQRFPSERIRVVPNGVDLSTVRRSEVDKNYILYLGRLSREKGVQTLLDAHAQLNETVTLKVCGDGPMLGELRSSYPKAEFLGYRSGEDLSLVLREASFVVVPSEWYENCPMAILEAMAYGKPVIASRIGGIPELVESGATGLLYTPGSVTELTVLLARLVRDREERARFGRMARARAEDEFSQAKHNAAIFSGYRDLVDTPRRAARV